MKKEISRDYRNLSHYYEKGQRIKNEKISHDLEKLMKELMAGPFF